jgi:hypothetical protein
MYDTEISLNTTSRNSNHHGYFFVEQHVIAGWIGMGWDGMAWDNLRKIQLN